MNEGESNSVLQNHHVRVAWFAGVAAFALPGGLSLMVNWTGMVEGQYLMAVTQLLGLSIGLLIFAVLLRLLALVGAGAKFRSKLVIGLIGGGLVSFTLLKWLAKLAGTFGQPILNFVQVLTLSVLLLVVGYLFEFIGALRTRLGEDGPVAAKPLAGSEVQR